MKIFIDTNIILEYLLDREESDAVDRIMTWADDNNVELIISSGSAYTLTYTIDKYLRKDMKIFNPERTEQLRNVMKTIFGRYTVESLDTETFYASAGNLCFEDLEDSYQWTTAQTASCDALLTLNIRDYERADDNSPTAPRILTPRGFITAYDL